MRVFDVLTPISTKNNIYHRKFMAYHSINVDIVWEICEKDSRVVRAIPRYAYN